MEGGVFGIWMDFSLEQLLNTLSQMNEMLSKSTTDSMLFRMTSQGEDSLSSYFMVSFFKFLCEGVEHHAVLPEGLSSLSSSQLLGKEFLWVIGLLQKGDHDYY